MMEQMIFFISLIAYSLFLSLFAFFVLRTRENNIHLREKLCREKLIGVVMAFIAFVWCAKHGQSIFPGGKIAAYFVPMAFIFTWLSYFLLDYLAARAFAALLILIAHYHLYWIFAENPFMASISSLACYILGTFGIVIAGKPCLLRDFFRKSVKSNSFRIYSSLIIFLISFIFFFTGIYLIINR